MVFGGLGEQDLGGRDVEAWFEEEQQWRLREDFRLVVRMPIFVTSRKTTLPF